MHYSTGMPGYMGQMICIMIRISLYARDVFFGFWALLGCLPLVMRGTLLAAAGGFGASGVIPAPKLMQTLGVEWYISGRRAKAPRSIFGGRSTHGVVDARIRYQSHLCTVRIVACVLLVRRWSAYDMESEFQTSDN